MTKLTASVVSALRSIYPGDSLLTGPEETWIFGTDASRRHAQPGAVVRPTSTEQVAETLKLAQAERIPVYPRGRATNVVGGCVPQDGGIVICTSRLNNILEISPTDFVAVAEPGVITGELQDACKAQKLLYAPDPASARFSTIGGNLAQNAGGMRAVKYGTTRDWILGLTVVLPGGRVIETGSRCHKDVAGLDLTRLMVGSEGTLGFVSRAILKLLPMPEAQASLLAVFQTGEVALEAVGAVFAAGILPTAMEFMSYEVLYALGKISNVPWPEGAGAALLMKIDGSADAVTADMKRLKAAVEPHSPTFLREALTPAEEDILWEPRRQINQAVFHYGPDKMSDDIAVPRGRIGEAVARIRALGKELGITIIVFGHLGDGNLHVNILHDASDPHQAGQAKKAKAAVLDLTISLGGTISGEHGVGLSKLPLMEAMRGRDQLDVMHAVKAAFDPLGIMNPGKAY